MPTGVQLTMMSAGTEWRSDHSALRHSKRWASRLALAATPSVSTTWASRRNSP